MATGSEEEEQTISKSESLRLKTLAEKTYTSSNPNLKLALKYAKRAHRLCPTLPGLSELLTAFKILTTATTTTSSTHWYDILQVEPFSHINSIKKQYKYLALILHPDKNTSVASEEAFKLVNEAFGVLSDKIRRKEYDMKVRIAMQSAVETRLDCEGAEMFSTVCVYCGALCRFERRYLGHDLVCYGCRKSFKAVEVGVDVGDEDGVLGRGGLKRKMSSVGEILKRCEGVEKRKEGDGERLRGVDKAEGKGRKDEKKESGKVMNDDEEDMTLAEMKKLAVDVDDDDDSDDDEDDESDDNDDDDDDDETMTLAQMQKLVNDDDDETMTLAKMRKLANDDEETMTLAKMQKLVNDDDETMTLAKMQKLVNDDDETMTLAKMRKLANDDDEETMTLARMRKLGNDGDEETMTLAKMRKLVKTNANEGKLKPNEKEKEQRSRSNRSNSKNKANEEGNDQDLEIMTVEDSDFYDFDKDRVEKSFKKGQIWALYDDDDGMPRHYGLIDEVVSTHPFEVNMSWLEPLTKGDEMLTSLERTGFHISCGRFKVSEKTTVTSVNVFSHIVNSERAARDVYRIYPKKGSVWALFNDHVEKGGQLARDKRRYDIVVFLTSSSEVHGLSMAYLEKVKGFKTTFRRREIGCHAIKWLEKHDVRLFSHQIPARKLSREEVPNLSGDCWELDPASLPAELPTTGGKK